MISDTLYFVHHLKELNPVCLQKKDELNLHAKRANYQAAIWRSVKTASIDAPPPEHHGWIIDNHGSINDFQENDSSFCT